MVPDLEMVTTAMLKSLRESIVPAIDPDDSIAHENAALLTAALQEIRVLGENLYQAATAEVCAEIDLCDELHDLLPPESRTHERPLEAAAARAVAELDLPSYGRLTELRSALREHNDRLIRDGLKHAATADTARAVRTAVLTFAARESEFPQFFKIRT